MKKGILITMIICMFSILNAKEVQFITPFKAGGNTYKIVDILRKEMPKLGWDLDVIMAGDCAKANNIIKSTDKKSIYVWVSGLLEKNTDPMAACFREEPVSENFLATMYYRPDYLCSIGTDIDPFSRDTSVTKLLGSGSVGYPESKKKLLLGALKNIKFVQYSSSGAMKNAIAAQEVDFSIDYSGYRAEKNGKAVCRYNSSDKVLGKTTPLQDKIPGFGTRSLVSYVGFTNLQDEEKIEIEKAFKKAIHHPDIAKILDNVGAFYLDNNEEALVKIHKQLK